MGGLRERTYRWVRTRTPGPLKRVLKMLPSAYYLAQLLRPKGEWWLPVHLGPGLTRPVLLPEAFHWISYEGYEPEALAWVIANVGPREVCLDVGGHLGVYALLLAELVGPEGRVFTFEPYGPSADLLWRTLEANGVMDRVELVRAAVDSTDGGQVSLFAGDSPSEVSVHANATRPLRLEVPKVSLDAFAQGRGLDRVDLVKMDIEGAEARALRGAVDLIRRFRPKILLEAHGRPGTEAIEFLRGLGYTITLVSGEPADMLAQANDVRQVGALP